MSWVDILGYAASAAVLATFCMNTMLPLRLIAISSNVLFITFGAVAGIYPVLLLHAILLPVNLVRLVQIRRLVYDVRAARGSELSIDAVLPFMTHRRLKAGYTLMRKGDKAESLYYLVKGEMEVVEVKKIVKPETILGEIGAFARDQKRTATVVCTSDCEVYELSASKAKELYFQDPAFGFAVLQLIIARLMEDINTLSPPSSSNPDLCLE
jgi:CRP/FNR family transcriptional regulator, cyclic AMP receptor protein